MYRAISLLVASRARGDRGRMLCLDHLAAQLMGYRRDQKHDGGLACGGCGMDLGFHLVYSLGESLWPKGTRTPHGFRNGEPDTAGGYALRHEWI